MTCRRALIVMLTDHSLTACITSRYRPKSRPSPVSSTRRMRPTLSVTLLPRGVRWSRRFIASCSRSFIIDSVLSAQSHHSR